MVILLDNLINGWSYLVSPLFFFYFVYICYNNLLEEKTCCLGASPVGKGFGVVRHISSGRESQINCFVKLQKLLDMWS